MAHSLSLPALKEADLRLLARETGRFHRLAMNEARRCVSLSPEEMVTAATDALAKLRAQKLLSEDEVSTVTGILKLHTGAATDELRSKLKELTNPILASEKSSPVAMMICSVAMDSVSDEISSSSKGGNRPQPRTSAVGIWLGDVVGAVIGGAAGGIAGGFWGGLIGGAIVAGIVSAAVQ